MQRLVHVVTPRKGLEASPTLTVPASAVAQGMPCTVVHPNDRYAAVVARVAPSGTSVIVEYPSGECETFTWRKRRDGVGVFVAVGTSSPRLLLGVAEDYRCPEI